MEAYVTNDFSIRIAGTVILGAGITLLYLYFDLMVNGFFSGNLVAMLSSGLIFYAVFFFVGLIFIVLTVIGLYLLLGR